MKLYKYIKEEGLLYTLNKICNKVLNKASNTIFLYCELDNINVYSNNYVSVIQPVDVVSFNAMKFFEHVKYEDYRNNHYKELLVYKINDQVVGYIATQKESLHEIHGLTSFKLKKGEAWIGPVYVKREFRGKGVSSSLIRVCKSRLFTLGINKCYTCINSSNGDSLRSFEHCGFNNIGTINNKSLVVDATFLSERT